MTIKEKPIKLDFIFEPSVSSKDTELSSTYEVVFEKNGDIPVINIRNLRNNDEDIWKRFNGNLFIEIVDFLREKGAIEQNENQISSPVKIPGSVSSIPIPEIEGKPENASQIIVGEKNVVPFSSFSTSEETQTVVPESSVEENKEISVPIKDVSKKVTEEELKEMTQRKVIKSSQNEEDLTDESIFNDEQKRNDKRRKATKSKKSIRRKEED